MAKFSDISEQYARQIRDAKDGVLAKSEEGTKIAATARADFRTTVMTVVRHVDTWRVGDKPITEADVAKILQGVDVCLKVPKGTMEMLKKGSVEVSLKFDQQVQQLLADIEYV